MSNFFQFIVNIHIIFSEIIKGEYFEKKLNKISFFVMAFILFFIIFSVYKYQWVFILDNATLAIHEAGHLFFNLFGQNMVAYGGTILQIIFPLIFIFYFIYESKIEGFFFSFIWLSASIKNISVYLSDARAQQLPLVGGESVLHDWNVILGRWNLLSFDIFIGNILSLLSYFLFIFILFLMFKNTNFKDNGI